MIWLIEPSSEEHEMASPLCYHTQEGGLCSSLSSRDVKPYIASRDPHLSSLAREDRRRAGGLIPSSEREGDPVEGEGPGREIYFWVSPLSVCARRDVYLRFFRVTLKERSCRPDRF